jgi:cytochrome c553
MALMNRLSTRIVSLALATAAAALLSVHGAAAQTAPAAAPATGDAARGKSAFMRFGCYECHGTVAQGNYNGIPHLAPHPIPQGALLSYIRKPSGQMPSYSAAILPDKDAADIWAYLASIPAGKSAANIPLLNATTLKPK